MSKAGDAFPDLPTIGDAIALRREEEARMRELTDLPEPLTDEEAAEADSAWEQWLAEMAS